MFWRVLDLLTITACLTLLALRVNVMIRYGYSPAPLAWCLAYVAIIASCIWRLRPAGRTRFRRVSGDVGGGKREEEKEKPLVSIVLLLRTPRAMDDAILKTQVERAWEIELSDEAEATQFLMALDPEHFIVQTDGDTFLVHNVEGTYFGDRTDEAAEQLVELRLRKLVGEHTAWMAVDLLRGNEEYDEAKLASAYLSIGKLIAELADPHDTLALFRPEDGRLAAYDQELDDQLRTDPVAAIRSGGRNVPVIQVEDDDPLMRDAVAEAQRRWPEFVEAFERRVEGQMFAVKARFSHGDDAEFMWLTVTAVENDVAFGVLDNNPVSLPKPKLGDRVRVNVADLNDWIHTPPGGGKTDITGGFTIKAVEAAQRRAEEARKPKDA